MKTTIGMRRGFTLVEILISLLVMGLAISGLLDLLHWGQMRYQAIAEQPRIRSAIGAIRRTIRSQVMAGLPVALKDGLPTDLHQPVGTLRIASLSVQAYDGATMFVHADLFDDRNRDGTIQSGETLPGVLWCFRTRVQGGSK